MLDTEIVVLQCGLFIFGFAEHLAQTIGDMHLSRPTARTLYLRQFTERLIGGLTNGGKCHTGLFQ